jgi:hypothetical protein
MSTYVEVPAEAILGRLRDAGFVERASRGTEIVYERAHKRDARYRVVVYTSVPKGGASARGCGRDAIRVCAICEDTSYSPVRSFGVAKLPRVHRTGSVEAVLERMISRAREAYAAITDRLATQASTRQAS